MYASQKIGSFDEAYQVDTINDSMMKHKQKTMLPNKTESKEMIKNMVQSLRQRQ